MRQKLPDIEPTPLTPFQPDWIFWVLLAIFILIAWIQLSYGQRFRMILRALFSNRSLHQLEREGNLFNERVSLFVSLIYILTISMVIYQVIPMIFHQTVHSIPQFQLFVLISLAVFGFWAFKIFMMNLLAFVFKTDQTNNAYLLNILVTVSFLGIILVPLLVLMVYMKSAWILYLALGLIFGFSLYRVIKGFFIGISLPHFSYFFLFVYLCTLEILPLMVAAKVITDYF